MLSARLVSVVAPLLALSTQSTALRIGACAPSTTSARSGVARMQTATATKSSTEVQSLLDANRALVDSLGSIAPELPELTRLRFALAFPAQAEAQSAVRETIAWRAGAGRSIVESAAEALAKATAGGGWDNEAVRAAAPHAAAINQFITPENIMTISSNAGDLVYVIRASLIDDKELMDKVSVNQLTDFLLYVKEVHSLVVNARSERSGRLCNVVFANDISGTRKAPDARFSKALTESSKSYEKLYPSLAGPTMILNLPFVLQAFVGLFKPLFPKTVRARLKFESAPVLAKLKTLTPLTTDASSRTSFLAEVDKLLR